MFEWHHLPRPGGLGAQDIELMRLWRIIRTEQAEFEEKKRRDAEMKRQRAKK